MSEPGSGNRLWHMDSYAQEKRATITLSIPLNRSRPALVNATSMCAGPRKLRGRTKRLSMFVIDGKDSEHKNNRKWDGRECAGFQPRRTLDKCAYRLHADWDRETCGFSMLFAYSFADYQVGLSAVYLGIAQAAYDTQWHT